MSVQELLDDQFEHETLKAAVGAGGVQGISQGPRSGGTAFVLLHHLVGAPPGSVRARGWWRAGPEALTRALEQVARRYGVAIRTRATVAQILVRDDAVAGVVLQGGEEIPASLVLSTADPKHTLLGLVPPAWLDPEFLHAVRQIKYRGATAYALFALDALPPVAEFTLSTEALASVVSLTPDLEGLERAADAAKYGMVSEWPHIELTVPTLRWPALAPEGRHVAVARVQWAPYHLRAGRWDPAQRTALEEVVARAIGDAIPGFPDRVTHCTLLAPPDLEVHFGLTEGAATHGEVTLDQMLFMRPVPGWAHHAMPITGLHLGSAGTHPGPGIAGGPGWLAARRVLAGQR
jgi:phytoene dehydrogenase-like protein